MWSSSRKGIASAGVYFFSSKRTSAPYLPTSLSFLRCSLASTHTSENNNGHPYTTNSTDDRNTHCHHSTNARGPTKKGEGNELFGALIAAFAKVYVERGLHQQALFTSSFSSPSPCNTVYHHDYRPYCPFYPNRPLAFEAEARNVEGSDCMGNDVAHEMRHRYTPQAGEHDTLAAAVQCFASSNCADFRRVPMVVRGTTVVKGKSTSHTASAKSRKTTRTTVAAVEKTKANTAVTHTKRQGTAKKKSVTITTRKGKQEEVVLPPTPLPIFHLSPTHVASSGRAGKPKSSPVASRTTSHHSVDAVPTKKGQRQAISPAMLEWDAERRRKQRRVLLLRDALHNAVHSWLAPPQASTAMPFSLHSPFPTATTPPPFPVRLFPFASHPISGPPLPLFLTENSTSVAPKGIPPLPHPAPVSEDASPSLSATINGQRSVLGGRTTGGGAHGLFGVTPARLAPRRGSSRGGSGRGRGGGRAASAASPVSATTTNTTAAVDSSASAAWKRSPRRQAAAKVEEEVEESGEGEGDELPIRFSSSGRRGVAVEEEEEKQQGIDTTRQEAEDMDHASERTTHHSRESDNTRRVGAAGEASAHGVRRGSGTQVEPEKRPRATWQERYATAEDCPVEEVLLEGLLPLPRLPELIHRVIEPHAAEVEDVSLFDFCAMLPSRQRHAVQQREDWLDAIYRSVQFQAVQDVRQLQLAGMHVVSRWEEYRDRGMVRLTPYSRGRLESAYRFLTGLTRAKGEQTIILTWLQKAIQNAIAEEFQMAALSAGTTAAGGGRWKALASGLGNTPSLSFPKHHSPPSLALAASSVPSPDGLKAVTGSAPSMDEEGLQEDTTVPPHASSAAAPNQLTDESELETIERLNAKLLSEKGKKSVSPTRALPTVEEEEEEEAGGGARVGTTARKEVVEGLDREPTEDEIIEEVEEVEEVVEEEEADGEEESVAPAEPTRGENAEHSEEAAEEEEGEEEEEEVMASNRRKRGSTRKGMKEASDAAEEMDEVEERVVHASEMPSVDKRRRKRVEKYGEEGDTETHVETPEAESFGELTPEPEDVEEVVVVEEVEEEEVEGEEEVKGDDNGENAHSYPNAVDERDPHSNENEAEDGMVDEPSRSKRMTSSSTTVDYPEPKKEEAAYIHRLGELMITQVNSADGFLHGAKRELKADERKGLTEVLDDDTAQLHPERMLQSLHTHHYHPSDSPTVRVLKDMWSRYHHHQSEMEAAVKKSSLEAVRRKTREEKKQRSLRVHYIERARFHQQKSVDVLVFTAIVLKSIAREESIYMNPGLAPPPPFGFPLLSSSTEPLLPSSASSVLATAASPPSRTAPRVLSPPWDVCTNMNDRSVLDATRLYAEYLSDKARRATPIFPRIDRNAGCSVISIVQSTMHVYETSLKTRVEEESIRLPFACALLGAMHVLHQDILPRINTISYHIVATATPSTGGSGEESADPHSSFSSSRSMDEESLSVANVVGIDLSGPFTAAEKAYLASVALPLGLADEVQRTWHCLEDVMVSVESQTGATVEHDVIVSKDDIDAFFTPTLAVLLPEEAPRHSEMYTLLEEEEEERRAAAGGRGGGRGKRGKLSASRSPASLPRFMPVLARRVPSPEGEAGGNVPPAPSVGEDVTEETAEREKESEVTADEGVDEDVEATAEDMTVPSSLSAEGEDAGEEMTEEEDEEEVEGGVRVPAKEDDTEAWRTREEEDALEATEGEEVEEERTEEAEPEEEALSGRGGRSRATMPSAASSRVGGNREGSAAEDEMEEVEDGEEERVDFIAAAAITSSGVRRGKRSAPSAASAATVTTGVPKGKRETWGEEAVDEPADLAPPPRPSSSNSSSGGSGGGVRRRDTAHVGGGSTTTTRHSLPLPRGNRSTAPVTSAVSSSSSSLRRPAVPPPPPARRVQMEEALDDDHDEGEESETVGEKEEEYEEVEEVEEVEEEEEEKPVPSAYARPTPPSPSSPLAKAKGGRWMPSTTATPSPAFTSRTPLSTPSARPPSSASPPERRGAAASPVATPSRFSPLTSAAGTTSPTWTKKSTTGGGGVLPSASSSSPSTVGGPKGGGGGGLPLSAVVPPPPPRPVSSPPLSSSEPLLLKKKKKKVVFRYGDGSTTSTLPASPSHRPASGTPLPHSSGPGRAPELSTDQWFRRPSGEVGPAASSRLHPSSGGSVGVRRP